MARKKAYASKDYFLIDENGAIVGIVCNGDRAMLGDRVKVKGEVRGYITSGMLKEGYGEIINFTNNLSSSYFVVKMDDGDLIRIKRSQITEIIPQ